MSRFGVGSDRHQRAAAALRVAPLGLPLLIVVLGSALGRGPVAYRLSAASTTATATYLTSSPNPSTSGQAVTLAISVVPSSATGTVTLDDGSTTLASLRLSAGHTSYTTSTLSSGHHALTAAYSGDPTDAPSVSSPLSQLVLAGTATTVGSSVNPSTFGQAVVLTASVMPAQATGTVVFRDGSVALGAAGLSGGAASLSIATLGAHTHSITADYGGDGNYARSVSATLLQGVVQAVSSTTLGAGPNPATAGQPVSLTADVAPAGASGAVTFFDGGASLGATTLRSGTATLRTGSLAAGTHSLTAVYDGDANAAGSTSAPVIETVDAPAGGHAPAGGALAGISPITKAGGGGSASDPSSPTPRGGASAEGVVGVFIPQTPVGANHAGSSDSLGPGLPAGATFGAAARDAAADGSSAPVALSVLAILGSAGLIVLVRHRRKTRSLHQWP